MPTVGHTAGALHPSITNRIRMALPSARRVSVILGIVGLLAQSVPLGAQVFSADSPTIAAMSADRSGSTEEKWQRLRTMGIPLVEKATDDSAYAIVTFLWRGDSATLGVSLGTALAGLDTTYGVMERLEGTTIWYKSFRLRKDARFSYDFTPRIQAASPAPAGAPVPPPRTFHDPEARVLADNGAGGKISMLELPNAPMDNLAAPRDNVPKGAVVVDTIETKVLGGKRRLWTYTPPGYRQRPEPRGGYTLAVFADGRTYQVLIPTPTVLDNGLADGVLPPVIAVFVESPTATRLDELACNPKWDKFIIEEVLPWIEAKHHVSKDPKRRLIGGTSLGGLSSTCVALRNPGTFGNVISSSGSFWHGYTMDGESEWVTRYIATHPKMPVRFYMQIGILETGVGNFMYWPNALPTMLHANRNVQRMLQAKGYEVSYHETYTGHQSLAFRASMGNALKYFFGTGTRK